jgi:excisionase family DNA binding protein
MSGADHAGQKERAVGKKISMDAAADELGVQKRTIQRFIATGELPAYKVGIKVVRVDADDVAELLKPMHPNNGHNGTA